MVLTFFFCRMQMDVEKRVVSKFEHDLLHPKKVKKKKNRSKTRPDGAADASEASAQQNVPDEAMVEDAVADATPSGDAAIPDAPRKPTAGHMQLFKKHI